MEFKERNIAVIIDRIFVPRGAKVPSALRLARVSESELIVDEMPRPYPRRTDESILLVGDVVTLTDDGDIYDNVCYFEQKRFLPDIKALKAAIEKINFEDLIVDEDKYKRVLRGINSCISSAGELDKPAGSRIKIVKGEGPVYFERKEAEARAAETASYEARTAYAKIR